MKLAGRCPCEDGIMGLKLSLCLFATFAFLAVPIPSHRGEAASFSCSAATAPRERLICADPELSSADEKLAATYKAALDGLSEEGRADLRKSQRGWIRFTDTVCSAGRQTEPVEPRNSSAACLKTEYKERQGQLERAVVQSVGLVIRRVDIFKATASEPHDDGRHPNFTTTEIAYPQIDKPRDEGQRRWNKLIADDASASASDADDADDDFQGWYRLGTVSPTMISVMLSGYDYPHGTPHGMVSEKGITWLLQEGRALRADDVFDKNRPWAAALARLVFDTAKRKEERDGGELAVKDAAALKTVAADPSHWLITEHGLIVRFTFRDIDLGGAGGVEAEIPWSALKPYFVSAPPFSIAPN